MLLGQGTAAVLVAKWMQQAGLPLQQQPLEI
jgi:hypothetical protein